MKLFGILLMFVCVNSFAEKPSAEQQALQAKFDRCKRGPASQADLNNLLTMDEAARDLYVASMRQTVNSNIDADSRSFLCMTVKKKEYRHFSEEADFIRSESKNAEIKALTNAELAFYTNCDQNLNPFYKNIKPGEIQYTANGLTETTIEMIRSMGPLLLEKGPDGRTALEYVKAKLDYANASGGGTVAGVYNKIKARIEIEIMELDSQGAPRESCYGGRS